VSVAVSRPADKSTPRSRSTLRIAEIVRAVVVHLIVIIGAVAFAVPLVWMVSVSFMTMKQAFIFPPTWIPNPLTFDAFDHGFRTFRFALYLENTAIITALNVVGQIVSSAVVAYSFARLRFRGREALFIIILSTMMLPQQVTMIPQYTWFVQLGMVNTFVPLTLPAFFGNAFIIFLLRQFFRTLPTELDDAAKIDGCGYLGILWRVCVPLAKPALGVAAIFIFIYNWNDFQLPLIYLQDQRLWTAAIGLLQFRGSTFMNLPALMAMSIVIILPEIVLFFVAQRYFVQGIVMTGLKG
jgi:ABC-type glycerol-3-phosphate transport system permease component